VALTGGEIDPARARGQIDAARGRVEARRRSDEEGRTKQILIGDRGDLRVGALAVVVAPPAVAENLPDRLAGAYDLSLDPAGRWVVRRIPVGTAEVAISIDA
jgi:hypothetical protein